MKTCSFQATRRILGVGAACFALQIGVAHPGRANEVLGRSFVLYRGMDSCREWTEARSRSPEKARALEAYALGFASGYNEFQDDQHGLEYRFDNDYLFSQIDLECRKYPAGRLLNAVQDVLHQEWENTWRRDP